MEKERNSFMHCKALYMIFTIQHKAKEEQNADADTLFSSLPSCLSSSCSE